MSILDAARGLAWPASAPVPLRAVTPAGKRRPPDEAKALADATVPRELDWTINWAWQEWAGDGAALGGPWSASYGAMYRQQVWVHSLVNILSRGLAALPLKVYRRRGDARERDRTSPLAQLLAHPYAGGTTFTLMDRLVADLSVYGNALALKGHYREGAPTTLTPVSPRHFTLDAAGDYVHRDPRTGEETAYPAERVYHAAFYNPDDPALGVSPLEPLRASLAIEHAAQRFGLASFTNGARPSGVISTDQDVTRERLGELKAGIARLFGGVDKTGLPAVLTNGLKWQSMSWDMQQAAVVEFRQLHIKEVCSVYQVPQTVAGELEHATFSNVVELNRMLAQYAYRPRAALLEETLGAQLVADFADPAEVFIELDFRDMLKGTPLDQFTAYGQAINAGWLTQNEVRQLENLPRIADADADRLHRPLSLTPPMAAPEGGTPDAGA